MIGVLVFFNDTATTEIYALSLHDALPIWSKSVLTSVPTPVAMLTASLSARSIASTFARATDRKSARLNSSHANISYAVFCLQKKGRLLAGVTLQRSIDPNGLFGHYA